MKTDTKRMSYKDIFYFFIAYTIISAVILIIANHYGLDLIGTGTIILATGTLLYATFTFFLYKSTQEQTEYAQEQTKIMQNQLRYMYMPYVGIEYSSGSFKLDPPEFSINLKINNYGNAPASHLKFDSYIKYDGNSLRMKEQREKCSFLPHTKETVPHSIDFNFLKEDKLYDRILWHENTNQGDIPILILYVTATYLGLYDYEIKTEFKCEVKIQKDPSDKDIYDLKLNRVLKHQISPIII